jgi:hypothetical protein
MSEKPEQAGVGVAGGQIFHFQRFTRSEAASETLEK